MAFRASEITCRYGPLTVVRNLSVALGPGQVAFVLGDNGTGKSTLVRAIAGLAPCSGRVEGTTALVLQIPEPFGPVSLRRCFRVALGRSRHARLDFQRDLELLGLRDDQLRDTLSFGQLRCVDFLLALARRPACLLLDEPTAGLSPDTADWLVKRASSALAEGLVGSVIVTLHSADRPALATLRPHVEIELRGDGTTTSCDRVDSAK